MASQHLPLSLGLPNSIVQTVEPVEPTLALTFTREPSLPNLIFNEEVFSMDLSLGSCYDYPIEGNAVMARATQ